MNIILIEFAIRVTDIGDQVFQIPTNISQFGVHDCQIDQNHFKFVRITFCVHDFDNREIFIRL